MKQTENNVHLERKYGTGRASDEAPRVNGVGKRLPWGKLENNGRVLCDVSANLEENSTYISW